MITGDESKRQENLRKHEMDFVGCEAVFDHPVATQEDSRDAYGKQRINLIGWLRGQWVHLTYTRSMFLLFFTEISSKQSIDRARYPTACEPKTFIGVGFKTRRRAVKFSDSL